MSGTFRPLAVLLALGATVTLAGPAPAQKPYDDPILARMQKDVFFLAIGDRVTAMPSTGVWKRTRAHAATSTSSTSARYSTVD